MESQHAHSGDEVASSSTIPASVQLENNSLYRSEDQGGKNEEAVPISTYDEPKQVCAADDEEESAAPGWTALPNTPPVEMKLFVGRVPRSVEESGLHPLFSEHGVVREIAIIKDRYTFAHKGCAFVRMASITQADAAIRALNGQKVLDPAVGPIQVRYATGEIEKLGMTADSSSPGSNQAKLFVGSLSRSATEEEVRAIFAPLGQIDEVFVMSDAATGQGKGCAFVKFAYKEQAINAIKTLSGHHQMEGASRPLQVRFAESKKAGGNNGTATGGFIQQANNSGSQSPVYNGGGGSGGYLTNTTAATSCTSNNNSTTNFPCSAPQMYGSASTSVASNMNPRSVGQWKEYFAEDGRPYYHNVQTNQTQWDRPSEFDRADLAGPPGANIFVFHVPNDWTKQDLTDKFLPFGPIVSARIATDKETNRNRGYAFVSYADIHSAAKAVKHMDGYAAGSKRLKVSIKKREEIYAAHLLIGGGQYPADPNSNPPSPTQHAPVQQTLQQQALQQQALQQQALQQQALQQQALQQHALQQHAPAPAQQQGPSAYRIPAGYSQQTNMLGHPGVVANCQNSHVANNDPSYGEFVDVSAGGPTWIHDRYR